MRWAVVLVVAGCASAHVPRVPGDPPPAVKDPVAEQRYQELLEHSTRSTAIYDNFDTKAFVRAVWQSPAFVEARVRREAVFKALAPAETEARVRSEQERCTSGTEFFLAVHANDPKDDDFSRPNTRWRLALLLDGEEYAPSSVERLGRTNVELRSSYSWMESFWVGYRVRFPPTHARSGAVLTLQLASAVGQARLEFTAE